MTGDGLGRPPQTVGALATTCAKALGLALLWVVVSPLEATVWISRRRLPRWLMRWGWRLDTWQATIMAKARRLD